MHAFSQFLIAFGGICGIAAWFLFQKTLSGLIEHLQGNHSHIWKRLGSPNADSNAHSAIMDVKLCRYILQKEYMSSDDLFVTNMGSLLRQRLLFSLFCLVCLIAGIVLMLTVTAIK